MEEYATYSEIGALAESEKAAVAERQVGIAWVEKFFHKIDGSPADSEFAQVIRS